MKKLALIIFAIVVITNISFVSAQEQNTKSAISVSVGADIVSNYVWRGLVFCPGVNIQPFLELNVGNFGIGSWGSYNAIGTYAEPDFFINYKYNGLKIEIFDYKLGETNFFNYKNDSTTHLIEAAIYYENLDKFPLKFTASIMLYGLDKKIDGIDENDNPKKVNNYSSYFEIGYPFSIGDISMDTWIGASLTESTFYGTESFGIVNLGVSASRNIKLTSEFAVPVSLSIISNIEAESVFFVLGFSF